MRKGICRVVIILLTTISLLSVSFSQQNSNQSILDRLFGFEGEQYFQFQAENRSVINELGRIISIDHIQDNMVFAYANRKEFSKFLDLGIDYEILPHPGDFNGDLKMLNHVETRNIQDWDFYPTYDAYVSMMYQFAADYPDLCQVFSIGTSAMGRELLIAKISDNVGIKENEPRFLYTSSIHGDELTGYVLMLRLIDYLLSNYGEIPKVTGLVENVEIWINPLANPDGTYAGGNNTVNGARRYNANWIDLNRNYPDPDDGPHPDGEDWQPETLVFMQMAEDDHFVSSTNIHGGEEVCNYPWDTWSKLSADDSWWQYVCHEYADTVHLYAPDNYMADFDNGITNGYAWYTITGGRQDYMNYFQQTREFTLEISDVKLPDPTALPAYWNYNYRSFLNYIEQSTFGVRGTVKDSVTGWPVKAEVYAVLHEMDSSWVYSTLPSGNYHRLLYEGTYTMKYSAPGYETKIYNNVSVTNRQATVLDVKLLPEGVGGIDNPVINSMIDIYPNPLRSDILFVNSAIKINRIYIYDLSGYNLLNVVPGNSEGRIDVGTLDPGVYFIRFDTEKGTGIEKLMISE